MTVRHIDSFDTRRKALWLSGMMICMGFVSIVMYMGSTIFYPILQFNEFFGLALHNDIQTVLLDRYVNYLPTVVFGIMSVVTGNLVWYRNKGIDDHVIAALFVAFFVAFVLLLLAM